MTVDLSEFRRRSVPKKCTFATTVETLDENDQEKFFAAIKEFDITIARIIEIGLDRGITITESVARKHRKGNCVCNG